MKPPASTSPRRLDFGVRSRRTCSRRCRCRAPRCAGRRPTAITRLKWQISRLCDMVQRFSTVLPPELCFQSSSLAAVSVVSHVTICLPSRLSVALCSRQATCSNVQLLLLTADALAEMPASAELPRHIEAPLTPVEHLDAGSWRHRRAVHCESEASMVLRMLELNTKAFDDEDLQGCGASEQTQVRQFKLYRGCSAAAAGSRPRQNHRQQQKYRVKRRCQQLQQEQQCVVLDDDELRQYLPESLQHPDTGEGGTIRDLAPLSSDISYTSSLKQEPLTADHVCDMATGAGNSCQMSGPSTQDSAFFTCSSNITVPPQHTQLASAGSCVSHDADFADLCESSSPSRRTLRRRCTAMTERLRSALVSADVIPSRIRELLSEAVDLVAPGGPTIHQDCSVSVDTLNCVDLGDATKTWDLIACDNLQASPAAFTCSMGDCSRGVPVQAVLQLQQQKQTVEWDQRVGASQQKAADISRQHHDRRQRQLFKLTRRRRKTNTFD